MGPELSPEEAKEQARRAAEVRWRNILGDIFTGTLPCPVCAHDFPTVIDLEELRHYVPALTEFTRIVYGDWGTVELEAGDCDSCPDCGGLLQCTADGSLRSITEEELAALDGGRNRLGRLRRFNRFDQESRTIDEFFSRMVADLRSTIEGLH